MISVGEKVDVMRPCGRTCTGRSRAARGAPSRRTLASAGGALALTAAVRAILVAVAHAVLGNLNHGHRWYLYCGLLLGSKCRGQGGRSEGFITRRPSYLCGDTLVRHGPLRRPHSARCTSLAPVSTAALRESWAAVLPHLQCVSTLRAQRFHTSVNHAHKMCVSNTARVLHEAVRR